ncbi:MAG: esterase, depolymerase [Bacteroidetes bacterium]|nr:esterase, depolymerase [Bacteroidota bacterium]
MNGFLKIILLSLLMLAGLALFSQPAVTEVAYFGANPGNLSMYVYSPATLAKDDKCPLVVVLHGCSQSAQLVSEQSGWSKLADTYGFRVLYPQQKASNILLCALIGTGLRISTVTAGNALPSSR